MQPMYLSEGMWEEIATYLFIDLKLTDSRHNRYSAKSRFVVLVNFFKDKPFNRKGFNDFMSGMHQKGYSANYLNNLIKLGKQIDRYYKINELQDYTYFKRQLIRYVDIFSPEEVKRIAELKYPYKTRHGNNKEELNQKYKAIYYFLGVTGCRITELLNLTWQDFYSDYVIFRDTKNNDQRAVPLPPFVARLMMELPRRSEYVFNARNLTTVNHDLKLRCSMLSIQKQQISNHIFRHSFVTTMLKRNQAGIAQIAKIVGHRSLESTQIYTHMLIDDLRLTQAMHPLCRDQEGIDALAKTLKNYAESLLEGSKFSLFDLLRFMLSPQEK